MTPLKPDTLGSTAPLTIGSQMSFPALVSHMANTRMAVGWAGEVMLAQQLERLGYGVSTNHKHGDLEVFFDDGRSVYIEVKTARKCKDGKWRFTLWKAHSQDHRTADYVALLCVLKTGQIVPFIIPINVVYYQKQAVITSYPTRYAGKLSPYRQTMATLNLQ